MNTPKLSETAYTAQKIIHAAARAALKAAHGGSEHRYAILASAFARGRAYRRHERDHRTTSNMDGSTYTHNLPSAESIVHRLAGLGVEVTVAQIEAWIASPEGAKYGAPPPPKVPYVRPDAAIAAE